MGEGMPGGNAPQEEGMEQKIARIKAELADNEAERASLTQQMEYISGHWPAGDPQHEKKMAESEELNRQILKLNAKAEELNRQLPF